MLLYEETIQEAMLLAFCSSWSLLLWKQETQVSSIILLFGQQTEPPRSLSRPGNS